MCNVRMSYINMRAKEQVDIRKFYADANSINADIVIHYTPIIYNHAILMRHLFWPIVTFPLCNESLSLSLSLYILLDFVNSFIEKCILPLFGILHS